MPMRVLMERKLVSQVCRDHLSLLRGPQSRDAALQNPHMPILPQSNLHLDILMGRDETLECADFMGSGPSHPVHRVYAQADLPCSFASTAAEMTQPMDIHADMEKKLRM